MLIGPFLKVSRRVEQLFGQLAARRVASFAAISDTVPDVLEEIVRLRDAGWRTRIRHEAHVLVQGHHRRL